VQPVGCAIQQGILARVVLVEDALAVDLDRADARAGALEDLVGRDGDGLGRPGRDP
jgi:hypothetical protein